MEFTSYQLVSNNTSSLNTGSYLNRTEYSLFVSGFTDDLWYGFSEKDVIEFGVWDRENNFIGWNILNKSKSYNEINSSYINALNFPVTYSYSELKSDFILYKNSSILVNPSEQLFSSSGILDGSYFFVYNYTRDMAGTLDNPLIIKDISPSRKELKLIPLNNKDASYDAFCNKKVIVKDVSPLYLKAVKECKYGQIYKKVSSLYKNEINTLRSIFFLNSDGAVVNFLQNLYEDIIIHTTIPISTPSGFSSISGSAVRIQGIQTYFTNYLLTNSNNIVDFVNLDNQFNGYVSASIERKFSPIGKHPIEPYAQSKIFVYDFFTKYFYQPISDFLTQTYKEKYFSSFKNAVNLGNNLLLPIIGHGVMDERSSLEDSLTLLVKLKSELPSDISIQTSCWISNISLVPYVVDAIVKNPDGNIIHTIGPPNFSIPISNVSLTNTNKSYTSIDLQNSEDIERELIVSKKLSELSIDYTDFQNFIVFSSAELRLNIFKNKVINTSFLSSSLQILNNRNVAFLAASGSVYPLYAQEVDSIQVQIDEIINSFDGYESYLYRSGNFSYVNGNFISSSYVIELGGSANYYDKNNKDSLINNCPSHILLDSSNDEYLIFLSMIGHFFDEIYIYISNMPSEKRIGHTAREAFTRRVVDYMLETFGWTLDDSLEQSNLLNNYLTSDQQEGLNKMSAEDRLREIRNRVLINLPRIYKTKGTEESVKTILACYGIPSTLLSIREYGGVNYTEQALYTTYERAYMYQWDTSSIYDHFRNGLVPNCKTFLIKMSIDSAEPYTYGKDQIMLGPVGGGVSLSTSPGSGEWALGFVREPGKNLGKIFFRIGYNDDTVFRIQTESFPLFDGNIYSIMLRRNLPSDEFEYNVNTDAIPCTFDLYVQRNEFGNEILKVTSSKISYDYSTNVRFSVSGEYLMLGGWFAYHNGQGFTGAMDKLQVWFDSLPNSNFEDYVNSINSYSFSGSRPAHQSLVFRMHTDYPFDMRQYPADSPFPGHFEDLGILSASTYPVSIGKWQNANPFYAISSSAKYFEYLGQLLSAASMDKMVSWAPWSGSQKSVYNSASCNNISQSVYPFQFKVVDYPSTWGVSKYGPNKFQNEKVRHITQSVGARFDDKERSTYIPRNTASPDSNQVGFFADPQDFRNKDIVRYFGSFDFMDAIGAPYNQYSSSYQELKNFRYEYATSLNEYSGSRILFNELITLFKLYFNRSIFEAIKNIVPARSNALVGVVIEPTILERPKYPIKPIFSETNSGSVFYADVTAGHYFRDPNTKLCRITESLLYSEFNLDTSSISNFDSASMPNNLTMDIGLSYINLPNRDHPVNYLPLGTYIPDIMDNYQLGHFAGESTPDIIIPPPPPPAVVPPVANFSADLISGVSPLTVHFINLSTNASTYLWNFGDGTTSTEVSPVHTYSTSGVVEVIYIVTLTAIQSSESSNTVYSDQIPLLPPHIDLFPPSVPCGIPTKFSGGQTFPSIFTINLGNTLGNVIFKYDAYNVPDKYIMEFDGQEVINTGYRGKTTFNGQNMQAILNTALAAKGFGPETIQGIGQGTATFYKGTTNQFSTVKVYAPLGGTLWNFTASCPGVPLP